MCTSIIEIARAEGMAKRGDEWFPLTQAVVAYDHARHAPLGDVITLDFINIALEPGARAGIELTLDTANHQLRLNIDKERIENAPGFDKDNWPDMANQAWAAEVHNYYGTSATSASRAAGLNRDVL